jgi:two-component system NtrC family response regulator
MKWALVGDYDVREAGDRHQALSLQSEWAAPLVTLDMGLPPHPDLAVEGLATLESLLELHPSTKVVVITGKSDAATALGAVERGAFDYLQKPVELDDLRVILRRALHLHGLGEQLRVAQARIAEPALGGMIGQSPEMQAVFSIVKRAASSAVPVLILGESGTGKELVARAIHAASPRRGGPFVAINCSAIPESLIESELFGHEKGAFTGAQGQKKGLFEGASGGTLFLDELGELPLSAQAKLLRFLQDFMVVRVGGREEIKVDARLIAATNVDLGAAVTAKSFREDLYYRVAIVSIKLPALRERGDDTLLIAQAILDRQCQAEGKSLKGFTREAMRAIQLFPWPGNVRQLENHVKRAVVMAEGPRVTVQDLQLPPAPEAGGEGNTLRAARDAVERDLVQRTLNKHKGNVSRAAVELGISRPTLHELITKHQIKR